MNCFHGQVMYYLFEIIINNQNIVRTVLKITKSVKRSYMYCTKSKTCFNIFTTTLYSSVALRELYMAVVFEVFS